MPLVVTHILFKFDSGNKWLIAEWSARNVMGYITEFEAFIGTVALGDLALRQNRKMYKQHLERFAPVLSKKLISLNGCLYLAVECTGQAEAKEFNISVKK